MNEKPSFLFAECYCGEINSVALVRRKSDNGIVCANCEARERARPEAMCARCKQVAPFERHHIHGRRNSDETENLCLNCHRITHALDRIMKGI
jgi:RecJ-like exonuclease